MRFFFLLALYRLLLPLLFLAAFPGWVVKMVRRGGLATPLRERVGRYGGDVEYEPCGAVHVHAVSVGEVLLAVKLIREWGELRGGRRFVLATGTATGFAVAEAAGVAGLRVTYAPLDFRGMVRRYLDRFEPSRVVLVEGEAWPHLMLACGRRGIPVALVNARMSPRSARRYARFAPWLRPVFGGIGRLALQDAGGLALWRDLGVAEAAVGVTGSLKIDPGSGPPPARREAFQRMLDGFFVGGVARPVVLAASTHVGEEVWLATAVRAAVPEALMVLVPRHAERRGAVKADLERVGFEVVLRSAFAGPSDPASACLVVDSTGELRDWTAHADVVLIGKSFLAEGGQNPCEAVLAGVPVVWGPHMANFQPLAAQMEAAGACLVAGDATAVGRAVREALDPGVARRLVEAASGVLAPHRGATRRIVEMLDHG